MIKDDKMKDDKKQDKKPESCSPNTESPLETGGPKGPEPTRYGDWEIKGKCVDF